MNIVEHTYRLDFSKEEAYRAFQDIGKAPTWSPYIKRVLLLNSNGVCQTILVSLITSGKEEALKFFWISKYHEQVEIELISRSQVISYYRGRWLFEGVENGCLIHVRHVVEICFAQGSASQENINDHKKEDRIVKQGLRKIDRSIFRQIRANLRSLIHPV